MPVKRLVETQTRGRVHELLVDGRVEASRLQPFSDREIEAASTIGEPVDRLAVRAEWRHPCPQ